MSRFGPIGIVTLAMIAIFIVAKFGASAYAHSAFAAGIPEDVASKGAAYGASYNYAATDGAEERALAECHKQDSPATSLCKVLAHFDHECVSVAIDPQAGTPGFGWAVGVTDEIAQEQSLDACRRSSNAERGSYCVVNLHYCDSSP